MAIKINNTTVINDSRGLENITNLKTVGGQTVLGTGDIAVGDVTTTGTQTLTNKTISVDNNTISGVAASSFVLSNSSGNIDGAAAQKAVPSGVVVGTTDTQTLTNKTISVDNNTLTGVAPLASPTFTGTPAAPTATAGTSTTQLATTAFVETAVTNERAATATISNKTLTSPVINGGSASGLTLNDGYTEEVFTVTGTTPALSPTNGSIQTWTLSGNSTPTSGAWADGQSITLMVDDGAGYTINWGSLSPVWKTGGGSAPTLNTTGFTAIALWKVGSVIYGTRVGDA